MEEELIRTEKLIGKENIEKLNQAKVAIFGVGGVGGFVLEGLVRSGIGNIDIYDKDIIDISNINRQIIALHSTIGKDKVEIAKQRALDINPNIHINAYKIFYGEDTSSEVNFADYDYIIDAIDTVKSKLELIKRAREADVKIISCMGTGKKMDPTRFEITDISKTSVCPLAKIIRKELKKENIHHLKVLYSKEEPIKNNENVTSSISFVPSVAGLMIAGEVIKDIIDWKKK